MVHHMESIRCFIDTECSQAESAPRSWAAVRMAEAVFNNVLEALVTFVIHLLSQTFMLKVGS